MREIKFRARKISTGNPWMYGYVEVLTSALGKSPTYIHTFQDWNLNSREPVDGDTVGQFTGLKDKDGVDIYEGDLVKNPQWIPEVYQVGFDRGGFCFSNKGDSFANDAKYLSQFKVIGNVYDNPEFI